MTMTPETAQSSSLAATTLEVLGDEHRSYRRFEIKLGGRFMRESKEEYSCRVRDISIAGVSLLVDGSVADDMRVGEKVIAYIDRLGGVEGQVVRTTADGFAFRITSTQHRREKLAAQITLLLNEPDLKEFEGRRHERFAIGKRDALLAVSEGVQLPCYILDISISGASIALSAQPEVGTEVWLGRLRARVVRHHEEGIGIQFMETLDVSTIQAYFG
jgi:hypothetical protein